MPVRQRSYPTAIVWANPSVTNTAKIIRDAARPPLVRTREPEIDALLDSIQQEPGLPNWNGEGSEAISPKTIQAAKNLLLLLPNGIPLPELAADPDGAVGMDWFLESDRLSASFYENCEIVFAGRIAGERVLGTSVIFIDKFPVRLFDYLSKMFASQPTRFTF